MRGQPATACGYATTNSITKSAAGINEAHALGKQFYVVANIQPHNSKLKTFIRDMRPVVEMKPMRSSCPTPVHHDDARSLPDMPIHLSVQANAVNWATVKFWHQMA